MITSVMRQLESAGLPAFAAACVRWRRKWMEARSRHAVEDLAGTGLSAVAGALGQGCETPLVRSAPPPPGRDALFLNPRQTRRRPRFSEGFVPRGVRSRLASLRRPPQ